MRVWLMDLSQASRCECVSNASARVSVFYRCVLMYMCVSLKELMFSFEAGVIQDILADWLMALS